ncbi:hypothetical protein [Clostridium sp. 2218st1_F5_2218SCRN_220325]|uniref:hypothetical protein n=1 Tax=Clostridium sp. 2218st1_F5_2218SCRN_220325 TaxID=3143056 RepID=UPI00319DE53C
MKIIIIEILFGCFVFILNISLQILNPYFIAESIISMNESNKLKEKSILRVTISIFFAIISIVSFTKYIFNFIYTIVNIVVVQIFSIINLFFNLLLNRLSFLNILPFEIKAEDESFSTMVSVCLVILIFYFIYTSVLSIFLPGFSIEKTFLNELPNDISKILNNNSDFLYTVFAIIAVTLLRFLQFLQQIFSGTSFLLSLVGFIIINIIYAGIIYHGIYEIGQIEDNKKGIFRIKSLNFINLMKMIFIGLVICLFLKIIIKYNFLKSFFIIKNAFDIELNLGSFAVTVVPLKITEVAVDIFWGNGYTKKLKQ